MEEDGPVRTVFRTAPVATRHSTVQLECVLWAATPRLDLNVRLDNWSNAMGVANRLAFPVRTQPGQRNVTLSVPFGSVRVGIDENNDDHQPAAKHGAWEYVPGTSVPKFERGWAQRPREVADWVHAEGAEAGLLISSSVGVWDWQDASHRYGPNQTVLSPELLLHTNSNMGPFLEESGNHSFAFSLFATPAGAGWRHAWQRAVEVNIAQVAVRAPERPSMRTPATASTGTEVAKTNASLANAAPLAPAASFLETGHEALWVSAVKREQSPRNGTRGVIVRLFDNQGANSTASLRLLSAPSVRAYRTNLIELEAQPLPSAAQLAVPAWGIETLLLEPLDSPSKGHQGVKTTTLHGNQSGQVSAAGDNGRDTTAAVVAAGGGIAPCAGCVAVFWPGLNGSKCYRIPSIIRSHARTLLAFSEARLDGCGDQGRHDLIVRRSLDSGLTWGPVLTVAVGRVPCPGCPAAISNPNPVVVELPDGSSALLLAYDTMNNPTTSQHGSDMQLWSFDDGLTWERAANLSFPQNNGGLIGPAIGLQAASGVLYFSYISVHDDHPHHLLWSSDFGETWHASEPVHGIGECAIAFLVSRADGRILMNCRTETHARAQLVWSADGVPLGNVTYPDGLVDANCQGSILNSGGTLYISNAADAHARAHMTVKSSSDQGATWSQGLEVHSGPSAYSQLVSLGDDRLGLLFEAGTSSPYETISFVAFG